MDLLMLRRTVGTPIYINPQYILYLEETAEPSLGKKVYTEIGLADGSKLRSMDDIDSVLRWIEGSDIAKHDQSAGSIRERQARSQ